MDILETGYLILCSACGSRYEVTLKREENAREAGGAVKLQSK